MDREERAGPGPRRVFGVERLEVGDGQRRLPVVRVQHVRRLARLPAGLQGRAAEQDEPVEIVGIVEAALAVEPGSREKGIVADADEPDRAVSENAGFQDDVEFPATPGDLHRGGFLELDSRGVDAGVTWESQRDLMPQTRQLDGQRSHYI